MSERPPIDHVLEDYCTWLGQIRTFEEKTVQSHRRTLNRLADALKSDGRSLYDAEAEDLVAWINRRYDEGIRPITVKAQLCVIRRFFEYLLKHRILETSPVVCLPEMICQRPAESVYLTPEECRWLLDTFDRGQPVERRDYVVTALLWSLGLRTSELCALRWCDINLGEATLKVRRGKNRKPRLLFINDRLLEDLKEYRQESPPRREYEPLFPASLPRVPAAETLEALSPATLRALLRTHATQAGIAKAVTPKMLRHTFATHLFEAGATVADLKELMGHDRDTETTVYIHVSVETAKQLLLQHIANRRYPRRVFP
jgi:site-specific recombinase XerD